MSEHPYGIIYDPLWGRIFVLRFILGVVVAKLLDPKLRSLIPLGSGCEVKVNHDSPIHKIREINYVVVLTDQAIHQV